MRTKGSLKIGGRKAGVKNKATIAREMAIAEAEKGGEMPLAYFLRIMRDVSLKAARRDWAAAEAAPYVHPKLQSIAYDDGKPPESRTIDITQQARLIALILHMADSGLTINGKTPAKEVLTLPAAE